MNFLLFILFIYIALTKKIIFPSFSIVPVLLIISGYFASSLRAITYTPEIVTFRSPILSWFVQSLVLVACFVFFLTVYNLFCKYKPNISIVFEWAPTVFVIHLCFFFINAFVSNGYLPKSFFDYSIGFFRTNFIDRPSGLMSEPSYWGAFCAFIWPGLVYCFIKSPICKRWWYFLLIGTALVTPYIINAKTFFGIFLIQLFLIMFYLNSARWIIFIVSLFFLVMSYVIFFSNLIDVQNNLSSAMRLGSTLLAGNVGLDFFPFGIGVGQLSFYYVDKYAPSFLYLSLEASQYFNGIAESRASAFNLFIRYFSELGVLGFIGILVLYFYPIYRIFTFKPRTTTTSLFLMTYVGAISFQLTQDSFLYSPAILFVPIGYYYFCRRHEKKRSPLLVYQEYGI